MTRSTPTLWAGRGLSLLVFSLVLFPLAYRLQEGVFSPRYAMEWIAVLGLSVAVACWTASRVSLSLGAFLLLCGAHLFISGTTPTGYKTLVNLTLGATAVYLVSRYAEEQETVMWAMCVAIGLLLWSQRGGEPAGFMANQNEASALYAYCLPAALGSRVRAIIFLPVIAFGLVLSQSFGGPVAVVVGLAAYCLLTGMARWWQVLLLGAMALAAFNLIVDGPQVQNRLELWGQAWWFFERNPYGSGLASWTTIAKYRHAGPHNEYLRFLVELGPAALVVLAGLGVECWRRYGPALAIPATGLVIAAVHGFYSFEWHIAPTAVALALWLGLFFGEQKHGH